MMVFVIIISFLKMLWGLGYDSYQTGILACCRNVNGLYHMVLRTLREIKPYEEITYDYNFHSFNMEAQVNVLLAD